MSDGNRESAGRMSTYCMALYPLGSFFKDEHPSVPCQEARGHNGPHRYEVVWMDDPEPDQRLEAPCGCRWTPGIDLPTTECTEHAADPERPHIGANP